jgi:hypothetical protein
MATIALGLRSWRAKSHGGMTFFVGWELATSKFACVRISTKTGKIVPFEDGVNSSVICEGTEAYPGLVCATGGDVYVDISTDEVGGADVYRSKNSGATWEKIT